MGRNLPHVADLTDAQLDMRWPVSGKPGQDVIVLNPMGLDRRQEPDTSEDYAPYQWMALRIMEEHAHVSGWPPFDAHNPNAGRDEMVGGIRMRGNTGYYVINSKGDIQVEGDANEIQNPGRNRGNAGGGSGEGGGNSGGGGGGASGGGGGSGYGDTTRILREEEAYAKHMGAGATAAPHPLQSSTAQPSQPPGNPMTGLLVVLLALAGVGAWYFLWYKKHHKGEHNALEHVR